MKTLGEKLVAARNAQNLTQEQLASRINVARTTISNWENDRSHPDFDSLCTLSDVLHYDFLAESSHSSGEQEPKARKLRLKLIDSPVIEVFSAENACVFSEFAFDLHVIGSDSCGNSVDFRISAGFCVENDDEQMKITAVHREFAAYDAKTPP